jgi:hypothetical protein
MKEKRCFSAVCLFTMLAVLLSFSACPIDGGGGGSGDGETPTAPSKPAALGSSPTSITLTWTTVSGGAAYKIYRAVTSTGVFRYVDETEENTYIDNNLVPGSTYYYKISAVSTGGIEGPQQFYF